MNKRYQVFISSTFSDLKDERNEVMRALLELDCIPTGMELFPAADDSQWEVIKSIIDNCDYYILILAGRYGSTNKNGISYTELEYNYVIEKGIPTISFLHGDTSSISVSKSEQSDLGKEKLISFRKKVEQKLCKFWNSPQELGSVVSRSLIQLIKSKPAIGWVKADAISANYASEILRLQKIIQELKSKQESQPEETLKLQQGEDVFKINYDFTVRESQKKNEYSFLESGSSYTAKSSNISWNDIFKKISPLMINESDEFNLMNSLSSLIEDTEYKELTINFDGADLFNFRIHKEDFQTIIIQLRALKLIVQSDKKRRVDDNYTYWTLTKYGDNLMTSLKAIKK